jgi:hypothetical protein
MNKINTALLIVIIFVSCSKKIDFAPKIGLFSGDVKVNGKIVMTGTPIIYGDKIETGDKSFCEIKLNSKSVLRLGLNSELIFRISEKENTLELQKGWLSGITRKIFTRQGMYLVKANAMVASVRGTSFCVKTEGADKTYFCVCNGKIELAGSDESQREMVYAPHHAARRFIRKKDGSVNIDKNPGLLYHTDENVEELARSINEKIDWTIADTH